MLLYSVFTPTLDMLYLTRDIEHRYLICHTWHLILTPDIWHMLILTWHAFTWYKHIDLILWHLTGYYYTWHLYYMAYSWLSLFRGLGMIIILLSDLWYSWTLVSPVLMSPALLLLLIAQSYRRPTEHAWCRDDEDVSHDRASIRRILNETKCHTE